MELDIQIVRQGSMAQLYSLAGTQQLNPPPAFWAHKRGCYWSTKIDDISLGPSLIPVYFLTFKKTMALREAIKSKS